MVEQFAGWKRDTIKRRGFLQQGARGSTRDVSVRGNVVICTFVATGGGGSATVWHRVPHGRERATKTLGIFILGAKMAEIFEQMM
jgi:hypothetical protein